MRADLKRKDDSLLRRLRKQKGLTLEQAARAADMPYNTLFRAEHGCQPKLSTLSKLGSLYGVSLDYLLREGADAQEASSEPPSLLRPGCVSGLAYHRKKRRMSQRALAQRAGIPVPTVGQLERRGCSAETHTRILLALAEALGVTMDELIRQHEASEMEEGDRYPTRMAALNANNPIDRYRMEKNLSTRKLAGRIGLRSGQGAWNACARPVALKKHIQYLSEYEGISTTEFMIRYGRAGTDT